MADSEKERWRDLSQKEFAKRQLDAAARLQDPAPSAARASVLEPSVLWGLNSVDSPLSEGALHEAVRASCGPGKSQAGLPGARTYCKTLREELLARLFVSEQGARGGAVHTASLSNIHSYIFLMRHSDYRW